MNNVSVLSSNWTCLSSVYGFDNNIVFHTIPIKTLDGYNAYIQNIHMNEYDVSINRNTIFHLASGMRLMDFIYDNSKPIAKTGGYTKITVYVGSTLYYLTMGDDEGSYLKLSTEEDNAMLIRVDINEDDTVSFYCGINKLITVSEIEPLLIYMSAPLSESEKYRQRFNYEAFNNQVIIKTISPLPIRFLAYRTTGPFSYVVRANGYLGTDITTNNYIFSIPTLNDIVKYTPTGLIVGHNWVTYYSDISNKENNKNVNIKDKVEVDIQHLIDIPYHMSQPQNNTTKVNISNLKSTMTETYNYKE